MALKARATSAEALDPGIACIRKFWAKGSGMTLQKKTMIPTARGVIQKRLLLTSPSTVFTWEKHPMF